MSKKIFIATGIILAIVCLVIFTRNTTDQQSVIRSSYSYADGSGNVYTLDSVTMTIEYDPAKLEESSSGMYSGGKYTKKEISPKQYDAVASLFEKAATNQAAHIQLRIKGSGAATIKDETQTRDFILGGDTSEKIEIENMLKELIK